VSVFGQKDIQQAVLIRQLVRDLNFPLEVVVAPTVREPDGLALSSRNAYLSAEERVQARALSAALRAADRSWRGGETSAAKLIDVMRHELRMSPALVPDYIAVADPDSLAPVAVARAGTILAVAARIGRTRLLDNHILETGSR
jgi:pantoate--beta-alanine ligase